MSMYRLNPSRHGIILHLSGRSSYGFITWSRLLTSKSLYAASGSNPRPRPSRLKAYTRSAIAIGLISISAYWAFNFPKPNSPPLLDTRRFQPYAIIAKERVSSNSSIYTLRPGSQHTSDPYLNLWARGIWSVEFKQPQLQIARSYTPLPPFNETVGVLEDLRFLIRREQNGEVSTYLDRLKVGAVVDIRGPKLEYEVPKDVTEVLFLAGGTGIAPALQVAHTVLNARQADGIVRELPKVHILWANRRREDCTGSPKTSLSSWWSFGRIRSDDILNEAPNRIVQELQDLEKKFEGRFRIDYRIDEEGSFIRKSDILMGTSVSKQAKEETNLVKPGTKLLLVSGPDGFVDFYAGPREWENGKLERGRLGGLLGSLGLNDWRVVKL